MKKLMHLALVCAAAMSAVTFTACESGGDEKEPQTTTCKVTFDSRGGSNVAALTVDKGEKVTRPDNPSRDGYYFLNWFKEEATQRSRHLRPIRRWRSAAGSPTTTRSRTPLISTTPPSPPTQTCMPNGRVWT
jgi:hypothetical protein